MVDTCNVIKYPAGWGFKREPIRPVELRRDYFNGMKFNDNFDWNNLWYDAVQLDSNNVLLIGPPLYGTSKHILNNCQFVSNQTNCKVQCIDIDRAGVTLVQVPEFTNSIQMRSSEVTTIPVNQCDNSFVDKICMMTLQKDNPISWITEWITYHHVNFGIDGFLIYDNNSTRYTAEELESSIQVLGTTVKVVEWNVPYGPQGFDCNHYNTWDSDYAQSTMFEHAKRRYVYGSRLAINCDIDELLVMKSGNLDSVINSIISEGIAGYCYRGWWIEPYDIANKIPAHEVALDKRQFVDYYCTDQRNTIGIGNKWMLIPNQALGQQWVVHSTTASMRQNSDIYYGHYMPMNTNWSWPRDGFDRDLSGLIADPILMHNLSKIRKDR